MFRRLSDSVPKDPTYPADLNELGLFINDTGHIRQIQDPEKYFEFYITNNERHNDVHREAFHTCIREEIVRRMSSLGIAPLYVPQLSTVKPAEPHTRILATPPEHLRHKRRVYVVVNEHYQELGVLSYRVLSKEGGLDAGSAVCVIQEAIRRSTAPRCLTERSESGDNNKLAVASEKSGEAQDPEVPGLVVLNPGELLYSHRKGKALSMTAWDALPRPSAMHPTTLIDPEYNHITGNTSAKEHVEFVFETLISQPDFVNPEAEISFIGISDGGETVINYLDRNWPRYKDRVVALALTQPLHSPNDLTSSSFQDFLKHRCRSYILSAAPLNTVLATPTQALPYDVNGMLSLGNKTDAGDELIRAKHEQMNTTDRTSNDVVSSVPEEALSTSGSAIPWGADEGPARPDQRVTNLTLSGGAPETVERILPTAYKVILDFFDDVAREGKAYRNPDVDVLGKLQRLRIGEKE